MGAWETAVQDSAIDKLNGSGDTAEIDILHITGTITTKSRRSMKNLSINIRRNPKFRRHQTNQSIKII